MSQAKKDRRLRLILSGSESEERRILAALDDPTIRVLLPDTPSFSHQLLALALVDLLGRVFPRIDVACSEELIADRALPPGGETLAERLKEARAHGCEPLPTGEASFTVAIGPVDGDADLYADAHGWQSYLGTERSRLSQDTDSQMPVGALVAAARLAAHTFAQLLSDLRPACEAPVSDYASALTYATDTEPLREPEPITPVQINAVLVGTGSIGGAAVYLLARVRDLHGALAVVDPQSLEDKNLDRAILATADDAQAGRVKVEVARQALSHLRDLAVDPREQSIEEYVASRPREEVLPLVCCAVDSTSSRREIQDSIPLDLIDAACNQDEVMISKHRTDQGPCVCCLHMSDVLDAENIRARLISKATGVIERQVVVWMIQRTPLPAQAVQGIELNAGMPSGSLAGYVGRTIEDLWAEQFMYGAARVGHDDGATAQVAAPWVTALGGFLLAAETLKAGAPGLEGYGLGPNPDGPGIQYREAVYATPRFAELLFPARWEGSECLCRSPRRLRIMRERYRLSVH